MIFLDIPAVWRGYFCMGKPYQKLGGGALSKTFHRNVLESYKVRTVKRGGGLRQGAIKKYSKPS